MARIVRFHEAGGPEVLRVEDIEVRPPAPGEVRIAVDAFGLNRSDVIFRQGHHPVQPVFPSLLGSEAAGRIESVGDGVTGFAIGDPVAILPRMAPEHGTLGALINAPARFVARNPDGLSMVDAAGLWASHLTAYGGLIEAGGLRPGEPVIITAASSSVGLAAIQIANRIGAVPIATTRDAGKAGRLREAGARHVVAMDDPDHEAQLRAATGGDGAALVFDAIGGPGIAPLAMLCARKGRYVIYGVMSPEPTPYPLQAAFARHLTLRAYVLDAAGDDLQPGIDFVTSGLADGTLHAAIDRIFPLDQVAEAFRYLESNRHFGKIVVTC